jgi:predicted RNA binding protein YcfA (HicA-like mRNA interferase family)
VAGKLKPVTWKTLIRKLHNLGFEGPYPGGKHLFMVRNGLRLTIPNPHTGNIGVSLLSEILERGCISRGEWLQVK